MKKQLPGIDDFAFGEISATTLDSNAFLSACGTFTSQISGKAILGYRCKYRPKAYRDCLFDLLAVSFPPQLEFAAAKRRSEYLAGRFCAQSLLRLLGLNVECGVSIGANREPIWPTDVVGSISHSADMAVCVATNQRDVLALGIDIEKEIPSETAIEIKRQVADTEEHMLIRSHFHNYYQGFTVLFSAKESIYKAAFPLVRRFFDFCAIKLIRVNAGELVFSVAEDLSDLFHVGFKISVNYKVVPPAILTITCLSRHESLNFASVG